ncbi:MAG: hypothetical protein V2J16_04000, partial [Thermoleophilia bacterium]|nr:hypothetical protein [Thermoleophilia bacterium]
MDVRSPDLRDPDPEAVEALADGEAAPQEPELKADAAAAAEQRRQRRFLFAALLRSPTFMIGL